MLDRAIIDHASPTLARLKLGNLFNYPIDEGFNVEFADLQALLDRKGVTMTALRTASGKALIYVYRAGELAKILQDKNIRILLKSCGYTRFDADGALETLKARLNDTDAFPHEIGVFLGYPLEDVCGFIRNQGHNFRYSGCWKVYGDPEAAKRQFDAYRVCTDLLCRCYAEGAGAEELTAVES